MKRILALLLLLSIPRGCSSFHSHQWNDANYQQPSTCSICHETRGLPLQADFDAYGIDGFVKTEQATAYITRCDEEDLPAEGTFTVVSDSVIASDETHQALNGYNWHIITMTIDMEDPNSNEYGFLYNYFITDFYDIAGFEMSYKANESGSNSFTVNYNGQDYDKCLCQSVTSSSNWTKRNDGFTKTVTIVMNILIPEGYDGIVVGVRNSGLNTEGKYLFNEYYSRDDFILYRVEG
ncbi:MAG: hypothetical protein E7186_08335 [Erysipelotrichaceae bacterium]|nr:hypothetical protein [Erysipelotrichaceae bacterium]